LYGDVINETGSTQELNVITATFYDGQGQVIAAASSVIDYWPIDVIPAGARLPFGILAPEVESTANFELNVEAQPGAQRPHQNFEVSNLAQQQAEFGYCLTGQVQNKGNPLQTYLIVMAVLYDTQDHVIKFGEYYAPDPTVIRGDQLEPFEICIDSVSREVTRHEVRVWGE
jgi:YD repeat-containing protein